MPGLLPQSKTSSNSAHIYILMGVSGCGKTTVAQELAGRTGGTWLDADDFHPPGNKAKMSAGIPLNDKDRWPWLDNLRARLAASNNSAPLFLACSALRQAYRDRLTSGLSHVQFVYLKGSFEVIQARLRERKGHFMPSRLLESQFAALEEPLDAIILDVAKPVDQLVTDFLSSH